VSRRGSPAEAHRAKDLLHLARNDVRAVAASPLRKAVRQGDAGLVRRHAHTLKSAAGSLGAAGVARLALELELIGKGGDLGAAANAFARLEEALTRLDAELDEL